MTESTDSGASTLPAEPKSSKPARKIRWPILVAIGFFAILILAGGGFVTATALEDHDSFCISCHTVPETTYFNRAYIALDNPTTPVVDLATEHYHLYQLHNRGDFSCIMCHRGDASLGQRVSTIALGGRDAAIFVVGRADPAIEKTQISESWLVNASCVSCHSATLLTLNGLDNHFHTHLPQAAVARANGGQFVVPDKNKAFADQIISRGLGTVDNVSITCTDCHLAHQTVANGEQNFFVETQQRDKACVACHVVAQKGPQTVDELEN